MNFSSGVLRNDEKAIYSLRELYKKHGYSHYKVSKFEEYDLYAHNKNFLLSENILSFTDTNGTLMALKPDVTLSIVKNILPEADKVSKVYYNEYVYRTSPDSNGFKEIMQTGLECIGKVDDFAQCEVIMLAMKSLETISRDYLLDISHMGFIEGVMEMADIPEEKVMEFLKLLSSKNVSGIKSFCLSNRVDADMADRIAALAEMYLPICEALPKMKSFAVSKKAAKAFAELENIACAAEAYGLSDKLYVDVSVVNDMSYYDGIIFNGFIREIPDSVLSGGRYDRLLGKLGKPLCAIGFAVYLDRLEELSNSGNAYDADIMLTYDDGISVKDIINTVESLTKDGYTVFASGSSNENVRCKKLLKLEKGGVRTIENND